MAGEVTALQTQACEEQMCHVSRRAGSEDSAVCFSTASNVEPQSKTSKERKAVVPESKDQVQSWLGSTRTWSKADGLHGGLLCITQSLFPAGLQEAAGSILPAKPSSVWNPSSNDFGIPAGGEPWSWFQTSAAMDNV